MTDLVQIRILDKIYEIACSPGKRHYVEDLGKKLNEKANVISDVVAGQSTDQKIVLTALFLMEEVMNADPAAKGDVNLPPPDSKQLDTLKSIIDRVDTISDRLETISATTNSQYST